MNHIHRTIPAARTTWRKVIRMLNIEELIRIRCQESLREAERQRWARRWQAGRWWRWLSDYAARRADRVMRQ